MSIESKNTLFDILIVEDNPRWLEKLKQILSSLNYSIKSEDNYSDAIVALKKFVFKLAILDIRLKDSDENNKDGLKLLKHIGSLNANTQVILVTGYYKENEEKIAEISSRLFTFLKKEEIALLTFRTSVSQAIDKFNRIQIK